MRYNRRTETKYLPINGRETRVTDSIRTIHIGRTVLTLCRMGRRAARKFITASPEPMAYPGYAIRLPSSEYELGEKRDADKGRPYLVPSLINVPEYKRHPNGPRGKCDDMSPEAVGPLAECYKRNPRM